VEKGTENVVVCGESDQTLGTEDRKRFRTREMMMMMEKIRLMQAEVRIRRPAQVSFEKEDKTRHKSIHPFI